MPTLYYTDYSSPSVYQQRVVAAFCNINITLHQISHKTSPVVFIDEGVVLYQSNSISLLLSGETAIKGQNFQNEVEVYSWIQYFNTEIFPLVNQICRQIEGKMLSNKNKYMYAFQEFKKILKVLDDKLKMKSFFVGDSLTLADIIIASQFQMLFRLVITPQMRKKLVNLTRWYSYVRNLKPFTDCLGKMWLCQKPFEIKFDQDTQNKKIQKIEQELTKVQTKQSKLDKQVKNVENQHSDSFNLDDFKRNFQNSQNKSEAIDNMFSSLTQNWSIWKVYYNKDVTEGKVDYLTNNLAKGTLQRLQNLRKTGFGNWGVYYSDETNEYQIRGVMLWKGQQVAQAWRQHPSHQYHIFHKLDPKNKQDQKLIKDYWLQNEIVEGLKYHNSFKII